MGTYEDQLNKLNDVGAEWTVVGFTQLEEQMAQLGADMAKIAADPGFTGAMAEAARALFLKLQLQFAENEEKLAKARAAIKLANQYRVDAAAKISTLPDAAVPDNYHALALAGGTIFFGGIGTLVAETAVQEISKFMSKQREAAAYDQLVALENQLVAPRAQLAGALPPPPPGGPFFEWPTAAAPPDWRGSGVSWGGDANGNGAWSTDPGGGGGGTTTPKDRDDDVNVDPPPYPYVVLPPEPPKDPTLSVDSDGTGFAGGGGSGSFMSGGGLTAGLGGAGAGAGALGVGAKLAGGGLGAGSALLGGGAGTGAGGSKNSAMMGGAPGGAGGGGDKEKRSGLGLIAPKLEDDEEVGPRSAAAGAGGRE